jgi:hypothetical protein
MPFSVLYFYKVFFDLRVSRYNQAGILLYSDEQTLQQSGVRQGVTVKNGKNYIYDSIVSRRSISTH